MDDYAEQQSMEIEALESILMDDLKGKGGVGVVSRVCAHGGRRPSPLTRPHPPVAEVTDGIPSGWRPTGTVYRVEVKPQLEDDVETEQPGALANPRGAASTRRPAPAPPRPHLSPLPPPSQ